MKVSEIRWLFLALLATLVVVGFTSEPMTLGASAEWINGRYRYAGGTSPLALVLSLVVIGLYILLMYSLPANLGQPLPGVFRRFAAFWLDFFSMVTVAPILGIFPMLMEWRRTRIFEWHFERPTSAPGDGLVATVGLAVCAAGLVIYYTLPLIRRRPSPGSRIVGYQIVCYEGISLTFWNAVLGTLLGFVAACAAYLAPFVERDRKKGKFWLDKIFGTHAVKIR